MNATLAYVHYLVREHDFSQLAVQAFFSRNILPVVLFGVTIASVLVLILGQYANHDGVPSIRDPVPFLFNTIQFIFNNKKFLLRAA